jgi:uncharacterized protein YlxP (DUF503 family)
MIIGCLVLDIHFPISHSLKDKRRWINRIKDRMKRYNAAFSELDFQEKWQLTRIGIVSISGNQKIVESHLEKILRDIEDNIEGRIIQSRIEYF